MTAPLVLLAADCATEPSQRQAPVSQISLAQYEAAQAPAHAELLLCAGAAPYNTGLVGHRGEILDYRPAIDTPAGQLIRFPTDHACLSSGFGMRPAAVGGGRNHVGVDLADPDGGFIYAAADGRISEVELGGGYGLLVEISHGAGVSTRYAHLRETRPGLQVGDRVTRGQAIGFMGASGSATGVHLHYEVIINGAPVDPLRFGAVAPEPAAPEPAIPEAVIISSPEVEEPDVVSKPALVEEADAVKPGVVEAPCADC